MLILGGVQFELQTNTRDSGFYIFNSDKAEGTLTIGLDISFQNSDFKGELIGPSISINEHETNVKTISEIVGKSFCVSNIETADEREDTFYFFEHEPFQEYQLTVSGIENDKMHVRISGIAIIDGYADPYKTSNFEVNCWLPIITDKEDWKKFGL